MDDARPSALRVAAPPHPPWRNAANWLFGFVGAVLLCSEAFSCSHLYIMTFYSRHLLAFFLVVVQIIGFPRLLIPSVIIRQWNFCSRDGFIV
jgi:hypothetical protein